MLWTFKSKERARRGPRGSSLSTRGVATRHKSVLGPGQSRQDASPVPRPLRKRRELSLHSKGLYLT